MSDTPRLLFIGDSVTDCGRFDDPQHLGDGYVRMIADRLSGLTMPGTCINRGISGNRVRDLVARWQHDCLDVAPDVVTILIGVNDMWRRYDSDDPTDITSFRADYRRILRQLSEPVAVTTPSPVTTPGNAAAPRNAALKTADGAEAADRGPRIILMEPFLLPVIPEQKRWREDLDPKIDSIRELAVEFGTELVHLDAILTTAAGSSPEHLTQDGVHPTPAGHELLAKAWIEQYLG